MKMNSFNTNAHDFRSSSSKRKCSSLTGCLIFVLLMSQTSCRPSETDSGSDNDSREALTYNDQDYMDPDETDWKTFAAAETTSKVHPIIFYKEDIVSEDYDPSKENNKNKMTKQHHNMKELKAHHRRKYKEISRHHRQRNQTESFRYIKPEKVYFDINPIEHRVKEGGEPSNEDDSSFNADDIGVEIIPLVNEDNSSNTNKNAEDEEFDDSKHLLNKNTKKFHHRYRRDVTVKGAENVAATNGVSLRHKRTPFYHGNSYYANQLPQYRGYYYYPHVVIYPIQSISDNVVKHPVKSPNYHNAVSPGGQFIVNRKPITPKPIPNGDNITIVDRLDFDDSDRPVWMDSATPRPATQAPPMRTLAPRRPPPPILQFADEDYVTSAPADNRSSRPDGAPFSSSASASVSSNSGRFNSPSLPADRQRPSSTPRPRPLPAATSPAPSRGITACIWAISSCCTRSEEIRYQCFERLGCTGAFWDLNPCADNIVRLAVQAVDQYLE